MTDGDRVADAGERVLMAGAAACDEAQLLAVCLGDGDRARAEALIAAAGDLRGLERGDAAWRAVLGRRWRRPAARLRAALELGRRLATVPLPLDAPLRDAAAVWAHFRGRLAQLEREVFVVLLVDGRNRIQGEVCVSAGTLTAALVHPREVFAPALRAQAAALVLVHNHPSGDPTPSAEDLALTERLRRAGELLGVRVLDHVVLGQGRYVSLAEDARW
ncbi:MAG: DNA repair protein RadC [bacterium]|nr:DNA repair protein RadC [bacterium]